MKRLVGVALILLAVSVFAVGCKDKGGKTPENPTGSLKPSEMMQPGDEPGEPGKGPAAPDAAKE